MYDLGDACDLPNVTGFSVVLGANLLCRLPEPLNFLRRLPSVLVPRGIVVLISPYSWLEQYTAKDKWIGGYSFPYVFPPARVRA